jgi:hypothetical protein
MPDPDPFDQYIDSATDVLGIPISPEWRGAIKANLDVSLRHGLNVRDFPLPDEAEPAPVFSA